MLRNLSIRNLAVIDSATLEFEPGFSVLTGETGAGKSILIDALGLVLGDRADPALVRAGQAQAEISAEFDLGSAPAARDWLAGQVMENPDDPQSCLIRRVIFAEGRTRASINGAAATAANLRELGERLVEIHGQHEHQTLLKPEAQRALLDEFGGYRDALVAVRAASEAFRAAEQEIARLRAAQGRDPAELEFLRGQLRELELLKLEEGELEQLDAEHKRLTHAGRLLTDGAQAEAMLYGADNSLHDQLAQVLNLVGGLVPLHAPFAEAEAAIAEAQARVQEAARAIRGEMDRLDLDPERLAEVERRMGAIHELARKHRVRAADLPARLQELRAAVQGSERATEQLAEAERARERALVQYRGTAQNLSAARSRAATELGELVRATVRELGMPKAEFAVAVESSPRETPSPLGDDDVRFDFSANPGQPARPLAKVASGGELSRVSLAIQVVANRKNAAATLIFDEVDAGIGGGVAEIVGRKLRELAAGRQVLSVTHLPQVAAQGQRHYAISKQVSGRQTHTLVARLDEAQRVEELARMQAGVEITKAALTHARELLQRAGRG